MKTAEQLAGEMRREAERYLKVAALLVRVAALLDPYADAGDGGTVPS
jgi:hypothetical protein